MVKKALIMVDLQNDFCTGGNLAVPEGDQVIPIANSLQDYFDLIIATQDWHPQDHTSFASNHPESSIGDVIEIERDMQVLWPDHCIQNTRGAAFHPDLNTSKIRKIFHKGIDKKIDSYSAFFDNAHLRSTGLGDYLLEHDIKDIYILGLATDYCVKFTTLDAIHLGFNVTVIADACRGVELKSGDVASACQEMAAAGVKFVQSSEILQSQSDQDSKNLMISNG